jgi:conjugative transposon TraM protein
MDNNQNENRQTLTGEQKQQMKKMTVFALMFVIFGVSLWLIFAPAADEKAQGEQTAGFNSDIPLPKEEGIIDNKQEAYEKEQMKEKQNEKMRSLQDFSDLLGKNKSKPNDDLALFDDPPKQQPPNRSSSSIQQSTVAYHDIHRTLGNFYETEKTNPETERLKTEVEALKARMEVTENAKNAVDNQLTLMEKSYQMAAKYLPMNTGTTTIGTETSVASVAETKNASGKTPVVSVGQVKEKTVSALQQELSGWEMLETLSKPRNLGFVTVATNASTANKNTISACILDDQTVLDGQSVRLRLLEPMQAGGRLIPRNTLLAGWTKIQGERLTITVHSLEYLGTILPVDLTVYDTDGQKGIFIPHLQEMNAVKEIAANMGSNAGTSISLSSDAGEQLAADMGRNVIQGVSQFFSKKMHEVKVHLKAGYKVLLLPNDNKQ